MYARSPQAIMRCSAQCASSTLMRTWGQLLLRFL